jgi:hypothetical protein
LFSGVILIFQGWRLPVPLVLAYLLLLVSWLIFAWESLRMRQWIVLQRQSDPQDPDCEGGGGMERSPRPHSPSPDPLDASADPQKESNSDPQVP